MSGLCSWQLNTYAVMMILQSTRLSNSFTGALVTGRTLYCSQRNHDQRHDHSNLCELLSQLASKYLSAYIYIHICIHICIHTVIKYYKSKHFVTNVCIYTYIYIFIHMYIYICMCKYNAILMNMYGSVDR